ncbi:aldo/keto reductase [Rhodospirillum rubrum F11]|uniref:Aldo/keto reductase n=2 Tax=Rhodospirillum rubrum TaxID=1085 RepID=Q2RWD2_RHORT|nr:aldo/keto reductase [Rhodospirillum rubrum]ABC21563.1 Aldo/keto reductase [Rhodospirillum rubrum ATCC 11170]AEO47248.1 aldo/keto reductase [Rhodospirillum rubrum F11]MBK5953182.1 aldo/keto reductase [Rhodospirillum rubrum]QXG81232.1 aldo/keto reductase [Rhodospirillum rubrum]
MRTRRLGKTALRASQVGLGTWPLAGNAGLAGYGAVDPERAEATVRAALAAGITLFDTAGIYGDGFAESLLGRLLPGGEGGAVVCTKGGFSHFAQGRAPDRRAFKAEVAASRDRLRREVIDIYLLHNPPPVLIGLPDVYRPLQDLRDHGWIGHIGVSVARAIDGWLALDRPEVEVVQLPFNLLNTQADQGLLSRAADLGKAVLAREVLANGWLSGRYGPASTFAAGDFRQHLPAEVKAAIAGDRAALEPYRRPGESWVDFSLRFVLDRPEISSAIVGARHPQQIEALSKAGTLSPSPSWHPAD